MNMQVFSASWLSKDDDDDDNIYQSNKKRSHWIDSFRI